MGATEQAEAASGGDKKPLLESKDVKGLKYLDLVAPLLAGATSSGWMHA